MEHLEWIKNGYLISTDRSKLDLKMIYEFLSKESYWSQYIPFDKVKRSTEHSLNFGLYYNEVQIGYARVVSDFTTVAYLGDVFILADYRRMGLSKWLMEVVMAHPELQGLRRWMLKTSDAQGLYKQFGWSEISDPDKWMEYYHWEGYAKN